MRGSRTTITNSIFHLRGVESADKSSLKYTINQIAAVDVEMKMKNRWKADYTIQTIYTTEKKKSFECFSVFSLLWLILTRKLL